MVQKVLPTCASKFENLLRGGVHWNVTGGASWSEVISIISVVVAHETTGQAAILVREGHQHHRHNVVLDSDLYAGSTREFSHHCVIASVYHNHLPAK